MKLNEYTIVYYESEADLVPLKPQQSHSGDNHYNWDNVKYKMIQSTTLGGAYRAFTFAYPKFVVVAVIEYDKIYGGEPH